MNPRYVRDLADEGLGLSELGGKGQSLARLVSAGVPVPNGFHITTAAYDSFVAQHGLERAIAEQFAILDRSAGVATDQAASAIAAQFIEHEIPAEIAAEVVRGYHLLG